MVMIVLNDHEIFLGNHQILSVDLPEDIRFKDFGWRTGGKQAGLEQHEPVNVRANHIDIVCDQEHGQP